MEILNHSIGADENIEADEETGDIQNVECFKQIEENQLKQRLMKVEDDSYNEDELK